MSEEKRKPVCGDPGTVTVKSDDGVFMYLHCSVCEKLKQADRHPAALIRQLLPEPLVGQSHADALLEAKRKK